MHARQLPHQAPRPLAAGGAGLLTPRCPALPWPRLGLRSPGRYWWRPPPGATARAPRRAGEEEAAPPGTRQRTAPGPRSPSSQRRSAGGPGNRDAPEVTAPVAAAIRHAPAPTSPEPAAAATACPPVDRRATEAAEDSAAPRRHGSAGSPAPDSSCLPTCSPSTRRTASSRETPRLAATTARASRAHGGSRTLVSSRLGTRQVSPNTTPIPGCGTGARTGDPLSEGPRVRVRVPDGAPWL